MLNAEVCDTSQLPDLTLNATGLKHQHTTDLPKSGCNFWLPRNLTTKQSWGWGSDCTSWPQGNGEIVQGMPWEVNGIRSKAGSTLTQRTPPPRPQNLAWKMGVERTATQHPKEQTGTGAPNTGFIPTLFCSYFPLSSFRTQTTPFLYTSHWAEPRELMRPHRSRVSEEEQRTPEDRGKMNTPGRVVRAQVWRRSFWSRTLSLMFYFSEGAN